MAGADTGGAAPRRKLFPAACGETQRRVCAGSRRYTPGPACPVLCDAYFLRRRRLEIPAAHFAMRCPVLLGYFSTGEEVYCAKRLRCPVTVLASWHPRPGTETAGARYHQPRTSYRWSAQRPSRAS
eukprot:3938278-Rhodomonas_salina.2